MDRAAPFFPDGRIAVGTSGWVYRDWRGRFYPGDLPQRRWLAYYASLFETVELNATTYRLPKEHQIHAWCEGVPDPFRYTIKLSRLITHRKSLPARVDEFIQNYMNRAACFEPGKVSQILVQFPPFLTRDDAHLAAFVDKLPAQHRYVVEFRDNSWLVPPVEQILRDRGIAFCIHDYPGMRVRDVVTRDDLAYVRLHGYEGLYVGNYPKRSLQYWARRIRALHERTGEVYVYFNNDVDAAAPYDAAVLKNMFATGR